VADSGTNRTEERSVLAGFASEQELGLVSGDIGDGGEDVSAVYGGAFHAVAMIDASVTGLAVQTELYTHIHVMMGSSH